MSLILGILDSGGAAAGAGGSYESIASTTVGSGGSATITFSTIPSSYKHLQLRGIARDNLGFSTSEINFTFNSDTASNYSWHRLAGDGGGGADTDAAANASKIAFRGGSLEFSGFIIDILDYADTNKYKTAKILSAADRNGGGLVGLFSGNWRSTSAITSITFNILNPSTTNFAQYSQIALYGIKGA